MTAKEWLQVMEQAADYNPAMTPLIKKYGEMLVDEEIEKRMPTDEEIKEQADLHFVGKLHGAWIGGVKWFRSRMEEKR